MLKLKSFNFFFITLFISITSIAQNKSTISGYIYDKGTREILIGASIFETQSKLGTSSNAYGFYSFTVTNLDSIKLEISYVGYHKIVKMFSTKESQIQDFLLDAGVTLSTFEIKDTTEEEQLRKGEIGVVRLEMKEIKSLPNLFGEVDIIKAFQMTPGVQSGGEAKSSLYVRGGSPDQNLILLDDVPLYNISHFGGFFSIFNADAINSVQLIKGGFPARFGSRLSSVLDIKMKEGNMQKIKVAGTLGVLSSKITIDGPIVKNKISFLFSVRKNVIPIFQIMDAGIDYNFFDINSKINYRISNKNKLFLSFYTGKDAVKSNYKSTVSTQKNVVRWGNSLISLRWNHIYNPKLFSNLTVAYTKYSYQNNFEYQSKNDSIIKEVKNELITGINDIYTKLDFSYIISPRADFKFGLNSIYHIFTPNNTAFSQTETKKIAVDKNYNSQQYALESAIYIENNLKIGNRVATNIGVRFSTFTGKNFNYNSLEPRVLIDYQISKDMTIKYAFSKMNQYIHLLSYSGTGVPSDYWMPSNSNVPPETSIQNSIGVSKLLFRKKYQFSAEMYHKSLSNLITFSQGKSLFGYDNKWENVIEKEGKGVNYGLELFLQKNIGRTTGWIALTIAKAQRSFKTLNNGKAYPFKYDRLLEFNIVLNQKIKDNITLSSTWTYGTGYPITLALEHYTINGEEVFIYSSKNSFKMRAYHRLDVGINFHKKLKKGERTWGLSVFNLYNRQNPYYYYYERKELENSVVKTPNGYQVVGKNDQLKLYQRSLFSIFPSFSYSFKF